MSEDEPVLSEDEPVSTDDENPPILWPPVREIGMNMFQVSIGVGLAAVAVQTPRWFLIVCAALAIAGRGLIYAAHRFGGEPLPRFWIKIWPSRGR